MGEDAGTAGDREPAGPTSLLVIVGLGSNQEPDRHLPRAVRLLTARADLVAASSAWATTAVGPPGQPAFFNAAVLLRSTLPAERVKPELLRPIEAALGRVRTADRFAPRPIDLDLVAYGGEVPRPTALEVPDPELLHHAHVALPASEVAPTWVHPRTGETFAAVARRLIDALPAAERPRRLSLPLAPSPR